MKTTMLESNLVYLLFYELHTFSGLKHTAIKSCSIILFKFFALKNYNHVNKKIFYLHYTVKQTTQQYIH